MAEGRIREVLREHFGALLNEDNLNVMPRECCVERHITYISEADVKTTFRTMKANKAP